MQKKTQISSSLRNFLRRIHFSRGTELRSKCYGIQRTIQLWIHGDQTDSTLDIKEDGSYSLNYSDENGNTVEQGGGGVAFDADGTERPLTEDEIMEQINMPEVEYEEDGRCLGLLRKSKNRNHR